MPQAFAWGKNHVIRDVMGMIFWCGGDKQFGQIERKREQTAPTVQRVQFKTSDIYLLEDNSLI